MDRNQRERGGTTFPYPWIPNDEIWVEYSLNPGEYPYIIAHEISKHYLITKVGWPDLRAHQFASKIEFELRIKPLAWEEIIPKVAKLLKT